jgi:hypothetical protein
MLINAAIVVAVVAVVCWLLSLPVSSGVSCCCAHPVLGMHAACEMHPARFVMLAFLVCQLVIAACTCAC